jgi:prolipoprotein diacylglyceryltransferase
MIFGMFLMMVFGMRFLIEFFKEPQESFEKSMILNLGQLLSIPLILAGAYLVYRARKLIRDA